jgi:hypothetical protein
MTPWRSPRRKFRAPWRAPNHAQNPLLVGVGFSATGIEKMVVIRPAYLKIPTTKRMKYFGTKESKEPSQAGRCLQEL